MPFYKFLVRGIDVRVPGGQRGFHAARSAFGPDKETARAKVLAYLERELTTGRSAKKWDSDPPQMEVKESDLILLHELFSMPNTGFIFFDERY